MGGTVGMTQTVETADDSHRARRKLTRLEIGAKAACKASQRLVLPGLLDKIKARKSVGVENRIKSIHEGVAASRESGRSRRGGRLSWCVIEVPSQGVLQRKASQLKAENKVGEWYNDKALRVREEDWRSKVVRYTRSSAAGPWIRQMVRRVEGSGKKRTMMKPN